MGSTATRYSAVVVNVFPIGSGEYLIRSTAASRQSIGSALTVQLLLHCTTFKAVDEHIDSFIEVESDRDCRRLEEILKKGAISADDKVIPYAIHLYRTIKRVKGIVGNKSSKSSRQRNFIKDEIVRLINEGYIVPETDIYAGQPGTDTAKISTVGIITRNRTDSLRKCLGSYLRNASRFAKQLQFVVFDNSEAPQVIDSNLALIRQYQDEYGAVIHYAGIGSKRRFLDLLAGHGGIDRSILEFCLFNPLGCDRATGGNRNAMLLHTSGEIALSIDDDVTSDCILSPNYKDVLRLHGGDDPTNFWFYADKTSLDREFDGSKIDIDNFAAHERMLGKRVDSLVQQYDEIAPVEMMNIGVTPIYNKWVGNHRVITTQMGMSGDCGQWSPHFYLLLEGDSHKRCVASRSTYISALTSRQILRVVECNTITSSPLCMAYNLGYDNRDILPPFFPILRNQDGLFGFTVRKCIRGSLSGHLPYAVRHDPPEERYFNPDDVVALAPTTRVCDLISACINTYTPYGYGQDNPAIAIRRLGDHLSDIGSLSQPDFEEYVYQQLVRIRGYYLSQLHSQIDNIKPQPSYWKDDLIRQRETLYNAITAREHIYPVDLCGISSSENARSLTKKLVRQYGDLLKIWPDIVNTTRELYRKGSPLACEVQNNQGVSNDEI